ncbi:hypothetical protein QBC39DRAFT_363897 [Podospora conica]|nr:hypothetical protein QBC39DRAFT_363897 [Schizothecium conicum]
MNPARPFPIILCLFILATKTAAIGLETLLFSFTTGLKITSMINGMCSSSQPVVQPTDPTVWDRITNQLGCIPDPFSNEFHGAVAVATAEFLTGRDLLWGPGYWAGSGIFWLAPIAKKYLWSAQEGPLPPREQRRRICDLQFALITARHIEPPTFFEYLGLDVSRHPFSPAGACASPETSNHAAAIHAILTAYRAKEASLHPAGSEWDDLSANKKASLGLLARVTELLLQDSLRHMYVTTFLVRLAGPKLDTSISRVQGRHEVLQDLCKDV